MPTASNTVTVRRSGTAKVEHVTFDKIQHGDTICDIYGAPLRNPSSHRKEVQNARTS